MAKLHPYLEDLRQARKSINDLGRFGSYLGKDGNNRAAMWSFGTVTGSNNPKAKAFLLTRPHWVRNLITPREGMAIVHGDIVGAETWLAAGFSGDPELMRIYRPARISTSSSASSRACCRPAPCATSPTPGRERIRAMHKTALLAINYGVKEKTLGTYLGVPVWKAGAIINAHKTAYGVYWEWAITRSRGSEEARLHRDRLRLAFGCGTRAVQHPAQFPATGCMRRSPTRSLHIPVRPWLGTVPGGAAPRRPLLARANRTRRGSAEGLGGMLHRGR